MSINETRISNERLAEMLAGLEGVTPGPWAVYDGCSWRRIGTVEGRYDDCAVLYPVVADDGHPDLSSRSGDREANLEHIANCDPDTIRAMILELQALRSTPVEASPVAFTSAADLKAVVAGFSGSIVAPALADETYSCPLFAHPLPNPSPSDGEVSEAPMRVLALAACRAAWPQFDSFGVESKSKRLSEMFAALQSKRSQP